ncbi:MAG TPA: response regulator [Clostridia bacterium]|nr:response regulator [Clostridia bacterium]
MKQQNQEQAFGPRGGSGGARAVPHTALTVLHIDDDANDTELLQAAVRKANLGFAVHNVGDGDQAMAYLNGRGVFSDRKRYSLPSLILLDLKMPRATGLEVLKWIRSHPQVGHIPVVVLSGSELQDDIQQAYAGGANSYLVKPLCFNSLVDLVKNIDSVWLANRPQSQAGNVPVVRAEA